MPRIRMAKDANGVRIAMFYCPGCDEHHGPTVERPEGSVGPTWGFNGNLERPTFSPSIRVGGTVPPTDAQIEVHRRGDGLPTPVPRVCHSFVRDGRIEFLSDCTHALAGQTVDLPELE